MRAAGATKGALGALTRSWAAEFSPAGVRVNTVVPGPVYTSIRPDSVTESVGATTLMARAASQARSLARTAPRSSPGVVITYISFW